MKTTHFTIVLDKVIFLNEIAKNLPHKIYLDKNVP